MEILAFIATVFLSIFVEAIGVKYNLAGIGSIFAVAFMGTIILWKIRHNTK